MKQQKTIFFDVTELSRVDKGTGIQRVTKALLRALKISPPLGWNIIPVAGDSERGIYLRSFKTDSELDQVQSETIEPVSGDIFLSVDLSYNISISLRKELHRFRIEGVGIYFVIYDLIPILYPKWFYGMNEWFEGNEYLDLFNAWWDCAISEADGLLCISKSVERDVYDWLERHSPPREFPLKIGYFYNGSNIDASIPSVGLPVDSDKLLGLVNSGTSFLMVGTLEPRKGHLLALNTFDRLWESGIDNLKLIIVGQAGWKVDSVIQRIKTHPRYGTDLIWLSGISDEFLISIYRCSSALLALSEAEGFGLPLVEAANYKLPVIARDIPVFREICRDGAFYFNGNNDEDLSWTILRWLDLFKDGKHPNSLSIQALSWDESARQLLNSLGKMHGILFEWEA